MNRTTRLGSKTSVILCTLPKKRLSEEILTFLSLSPDEITDRDEQSPCVIFQQRRGMDNEGVSDDETVVISICVISWWLLVHERSVVGTVYFQGASPQLQKIWLCTCAEDCDYYITTQQ